MTLLFSGCAETDKPSNSDKKIPEQTDTADIETTDDAVNTDPSELQDNPNYKLKTIDMSKNDKERLAEKVFTVMESCRSIYEEIETEDVYNVV